MNAFLQFLLENIGNIIVVIVVVTLGIIMFKKDKKTLYKILLVLVTEVEKKIEGDKKGREKLELVATKAYNYLPSILRWFISKELLKDWIEEALIQAKIYWAEYPDILNQCVSDDVILLIDKK